jgi:hypothetical protein
MLETIMRQRADQAVSGDGRAPVGGTAELDKEVEDALRHGPAQREVTAQLRRGVIGDEQRVWSGGVGRRRAELVQPYPTPAVELVRDEADWGPAVKLEVDQPNLLKITQHRGGA